MLTALAPASFSRRNSARRFLLPTHTRSAFFPLTGSGHPLTPPTPHSAAHDTARVWTNGSAERDRRTPYLSPQKRGSVLYVDYCLRATYLHNSLYTKYTLPHFTIMPATTTLNTANYYAASVAACYATRPTCRAKDDLPATCCLPRWYRTRGILPGCTGPVLPSPLPSLYYLSSTSFPCGRTCHAATPLHSGSLSMIRLSTTVRTVERSLLSFVE